MLTVIETFRAWWDKPAFFWQFWLPKSGPCFWFVAGSLIGMMVVGVL